TDWNGFVTTDGHGRVDGRADVFAAGDMADYPVKQGGVAAQQADEVAHAVARQLGAPLPAVAGPCVLRAMVAGAGQPLFLRADLDERGHPLAGRSSVADEAP